MVSVTLSHVIGTTALISILIVSGMYCSISYSSFETRIVQTQLEEITSYVASNVIDLVSLCSLNGLDQLIIEELTVPERIGTYFYNITIVQVKDPTTQEAIFTARAYLESRPTINKETNLPFSADGNLDIYNGAGSPEITDPTLHPKVDVSSRMTTVVAWCLREDEKVTIGLGVKD